MMWSSYQRKPNTDLTALQADIFKEQRQNSPDILHLPIQSHCIR